MSKWCANTGSKIRVIEVPSRWSRSSYKCGKIAVEMKPLSVKTWAVTAARLHNRCYSTQMPRLCLPAGVICAGFTLRREYLVALRATERKDGLTLNVVLVAAAT